MRRHIPVLLFSLLSLLLLHAAPSTAEVGAKPATNYFDPARHMRVTEVRTGMTGYGLSVFHGTKIEKFNVQVISILHDFNPKFDVILVRLSGQNLEHTGSIAGMSGSPIYLKDDQGRYRLAGAFAYGWPLMKDPIGGVQPIEYMLKIHPKVEPSPSTNPTTEPALGSSSDTHPSGNGAADAGNAKRAGRLNWNLSDLVMLPGMQSPPAAWPFASLNTMRPNLRLGVDDLAATELKPLATPLMTAGISQKLIDAMSPVLRAYGLTPLQAGGIGSAPSDPSNNAPLEPGSVLAVPLLTGDVEMTAVGTCTERLGDHVWGFGHPFNNEGEISLPLAGGEINGIIANLMTSFKLGAMGRTWGTLSSDEQVGVAGCIGPRPPMIPIDIKVHYTNGAPDRSYHFDAAWHPRFTPLLASAAISSAVTGLHDLPQYNTIDYHATIDFDNGQEVHLANSLVNVSMPELFGEFGVPMMAAAQNPFDQVRVKRITGVMNVTPEAREATIQWVNVPRLKFRPGETLKAYVNYRPFRAPDKVIPIDFELPRDLPEGTYQLTVSGWEQFLADERTARPFRFSAENASDVFSVIRDLVSFRHDAIYVRLVRAQDGIAIGHTAMPNLPSSMREVMLGAGRSNTTPFVSSTTSVIPAPDLMSGAAQFEVTIDKNAHVETGVGKPPPKHETPILPSAPASPGAPTITSPQSPGAPAGPGDPGT